MTRTWSNLCQSRKQVQGDASYAGPTGPDDTTASPPEPAPPPGPEDAYDAEAKAEAGWHADESKKEGAAAPEEETPAAGGESPADGDEEDATAAARDYSGFGRELGGALGWYGGPMGSAIGMAAGGLLGKMASGKGVTGEDVARASAWRPGLSAAAQGKALNALGGLFGGGEEAAGGGEGGATTVGGANVGGGMDESIRLLQEISNNIKTLLNDGLFVRGDHRRAGSSII